MRALIAIAALAAPLAAAAQDGMRCDIRIDAPEFGFYNVLSPVAETAIGTVDINCFPPALVVSPSIRLSPGISGQQIERAMSNGDHELRYNLYADPSHHYVLGDGTGGTVRPTSRARRPGRANFRMYGFIPPRQKVPPGIYTDVIYVTVEF